MTEAKCGSCGSVILREVGQVSLATVLVCPSCSSSVQVSGVSASGVQTVPVAGSASSAAAGAQSPPLDPYRTGTIVLEAEDSVEAAASVEVKVKGYLTQEGVSSETEDVRLRKVTVVGRAQGEIQVDDSAVSARHFQIEERGTEFYVVDLGSSNGTFVNGTVVRSARLHSGDRIQAGTTVFTFSVRHSIPM